MTGAAETRARPELSPQIGLFGAVMLVIGGVVGVGIFINPAVTERYAGSPILATAAWTFGGLIALLGALVFGELGARVPRTGGEYSYLREAFGPIAGFLYAWTTLLVAHTGGLAAVAIVFAQNLHVATGWTWPQGPLVVAVIAALTLVNMAGVEAGDRTQIGLGALKLAAVGAIVGAGFLAAPAVESLAAVAIGHGPAPRAFGAALVPVMFSFGGWQTASYVAGELKRPERDLAFALVIGIASVLALYLMVNLACLRALGPAGLSATMTPAADVLGRWAGPLGARLAASAVAISALALLAQGLLTGPRLLYALARDGMAIRWIGEVSARRRTPAAAIALTGAWTAFLALNGAYERLLAYVAAMGSLFFAASAAALFMLRKRGVGENLGRFRTPLHPWTTLIFMIACLATVGAAAWAFPIDTALGFGVMAAGLPLYAWLHWRSRGDEFRNQAASSPNLPDR